MRTPVPSGFRLYLPSVADGTTPVAAWGTSLTPTQDAYPAYTQVIDGSTFWPAGSGDAYGIRINFNSNDVATANRDTIVKIGIDLAGGTSYTDFISHLLASCASSYLGSTFGQTGVSYFFPVRIPNGSSLAAAASIHSATVGTLRVNITLCCLPSNPAAHWYGTFVQTFGADTANSRGTTHTQGTASEGAWTQLGSALDKAIQYWEFGYGTDDTTMQANTSHVDIGIGDGSNKRVVISNAVVANGSSENISKPVAGQYAPSAIGDLVYGRSQRSNATTDTNVSLIAYGVG